MDVAHLTQPQMATFQQHGAYLSKLRDQGVVIVGGHTDNMQHMRAIIIVKAKDAAAARTLATEDPAVKGGLLKFSVEPFTLAIAAKVVLWDRPPGLSAFTELPAPYLRAPGAEHPARSACHRPVRSKDR